MDEEWRVVPGWDRYEVSSLGRARRADTRLVTVIICGVSQRGRGKGLRTGSRNYRSCPKCGLDRS